MRRPHNGFTLVEVMVAVAVIAFCLLGIIKLMASSQKGLVQSLGSLQAQASAENLLQQIRQMKWDTKSQPGQRASLDGTPLPTVRDNCDNPVEPKENRKSIADWNCYKDTDVSLNTGDFNRTVRVDFVDLVGDRIVATNNVTDRKRVTVTARPVTKKGSFRDVQDSTLTAIFYNLPDNRP